MGFKEFFGKMKENAAKNAKVIKRYNDGGFFGNIDKGLKDGDFGIGTYLNVDRTTGLIYGVNIEDYTFTADNIAGFEIDENCNAEIAKGGNSYPATRCIITFKDGKKAQADILKDKVEIFKKRFIGETE